jgi:hypothetical protein
MSVVVTNGCDAGLVAQVAREPGVKVVPQTHFFIAWLDRTEYFYRGVERDVTPELHEFLKATGQPV